MSYITGVGLIARKAAEWIPTVEDWSVDEQNTVLFKLICPGKTHYTTITLEDCFKEETIDGRKCEVSNKNTLGL